MAFQTGQPLHKNLTATFLNGLAEMLRHYQNNGRQFGGGPVSMPGSTVVWVKNTTSAKVDTFGVLALSAPIIDLSTVTHEKFNGIRFEGIAPSTSTPHYGKFAVLQEPADKNGGFARAVIAGQTLCKLTITHAEDGAADITNSSTVHLTTSSLGTARILWKQSGTGSGKLGLVDLGDSILTCVGKASADIALNATTGTANVWTPTFSGATGQTLSDLHNHTVAITSGMKVSVTMILPLGTKIVTPLECA